jgi:hypothetical protein
MNHPFNLRPEELTIADLSFNETSDSTGVAGAGAGNGLESFFTTTSHEGGGFPLPIDPPIHFPMHPPVVIHPQPTPRPHPRPWPRPRHDQHFA